jgi:hypothetical protein
MSLAEIAADPWAEGTEPLGFLPAQALGLTPMSPDYELALRQIVHQAQAHAGEINQPGPGLMRNLYRYYGAEAVLARARVGSASVSGDASVSLSSGDLLHWREMLERARVQIDQEAPFARAQGVYFAPLDL